MALKDLTTETLIAVLDAWLDPKRQRPKIQASPRAGTLLPDLAAAREGLGATHAPPGVSPLVKRLSDECLGLDGTHDRKARGIDRVLEGLAELVDDDELAAGLTALRDEVLGPRGLTVVNASYTDEATNASLVDERLSKDSRALLAKVKVNDRTLAAWVKDWQKAAAELGAKDAEKTAAEAADKQKQTPADAVRARNAAIRAVSAFLAMLELDAPADDVRAAIVGKLEEALAKAGRRSKKGGQGAAPGAGTPTPAAGPSGPAA